jgi:hypothetical protein
MSLGAIIKRHKRTLINFQQSFLLPFVTKAAHRYMQFDPENYPVSDYKFNATSTLGIIAREYEVTQMVQLLQTMKQDSPLYPVLIESIVENMNLSNREELISALQQAAQPDPQAQQAAQAQQQAQLEFQTAQTAVLKAQEAESMARAQKYMVDAQMAPRELELDLMRVATNNLENGVDDDREFERRLKVAQVALKERDLNIKEGAMNGLNATRTATATQPANQQPQQPVSPVQGFGRQGGNFGGQDQ